MGAGSGAAICHSRILALLELAQYLLCASLVAQPEMRAELKMKGRSGESPEDPQCEHLNISSLLWPLKKWCLLRKKTAD